MNNNVNLKFGNFLKKRIINLSAQILSGAITREDALSIIKQPFGNKKEIKELRDFVIKKLDLTEKEFETIWNAPNMMTFDYPSNYNLVYGNINKVAPLIKRIFDYQPMSITEHEIKKTKNYL